MKNIAIIGVTGSIGTQTLEVIRNNSEKFNLVAMSFGYDFEYEKACEIIEEFNPKVVSCIEKSTYSKLCNKYTTVEFMYGEEGLSKIAAFEYDIFVNSVVGSVGLVPTLIAIENRKTVCLANKETLVIAGEIVMKKARECGVNIFPIDSEHSAIFQCLSGENPKEVKKIILTASGGSFRNMNRDELKTVTVEDALNHPNWSMGQKITIDSATMMNKGLEIIEAHHLFNVDYDNIDVVLHYESIIHSMVEFCDNSVMAQLGTADMTTPISYALSYPNRLPTKKAELDLVSIATLNFKKLSFDRFPCVAYAYEAGKIGHTMPAVLNAANEVAVEAFLNKKISFLQIEEVIKNAMNNHKVVKNPTLNDIIKVDGDVRAEVKELISWM
ncbi:MAG: 1-deoxy-D-xylulose-5-phosphate reductoisomerase [Bacilli bacterium]